MEAAKSSRWPSSHGNLLCMSLEKRKVFFGVLQPCVSSKARRKLFWEKDNNIFMVFVIRRASLSSKFNDHHVPVSLLLGLDNYFQIYGQPDASLNFLLSELPTQKGFRGMLEHKSVPVAENREYFSYQRFRHATRWSRKLGSSWTESLCFRLSLSLPETSLVNYGKRIESWKGLINSTSIGNLQSQTFVRAILVPNKLNAFPMKADNGWTSLLSTLPENSPAQMIPLKNLCLSEWNAWSACLLRPTNKQNRRDGNLKLMFKVGALISISGEASSRSMAAKVFASIERLMSTIEGVVRCCWLTGN